VECSDKIEPKHGLIEIVADASSCSGRLQGCEGSQFCYAMEE
jgi:hypothetical protein